MSNVTRFDPDLDVIVGVTLVAWAIAASAAGETRAASRLTRRLPGPLRRATSAYVHTLVVTWLVGRSDHLKKWQV